MWACFRTGYLHLEVTSSLLYIHLTTGPSNITLSMKNAKMTDFNAD